MGLCEPVAEGSADECQADGRRRLTGRMVIRRTHAQEKRQWETTHRFPGTPALPGNFWEIWKMRAPEQAGGWGERARISQPPDDA